MLLTPNKNPTDDAESNEKGDLANRNLLKTVRKWMEKKQHKPNC